MNTEFDFAEACYPDRWKVLGKLLEPFKVGHSLLLARLASPVIEGISVNKIRCPDLIQAVEICSRDFKSAEKWTLGKASLSLKLRTVRLSLASKLNPKFLKTEAIKFSEYFADAQRPPRGIFRKQGGAVEAAGEPLPVLYFCDLASRFGISWEELMDMPLRKANFLRHRLFAEAEQIRWRPAWMEGMPNG